jgi:hypothetical protein
MKVKDAYEIQQALELAEIKNTDEYERMMNVKWVNLKEIRKVVADFVLGDLELTLEQCIAFRSFFNELTNIEFRPYLRCLKPTEHCAVCQFLKPCQELNPKLDLSSFGNKATGDKP